MPSKLLNILVINDERISQLGVNCYVTQVTTSQKDRAKSVQEALQESTL